ncbi:unnamed protein product [Paramecium sonneborni]|uniref:Uncharacterized protein n=1 Tax=Paramecium sonneborni TaxID=65129 RepID=A0A8S1Q429_9CILI|nr:unnamed protein product [Paramecium sonneborni]
MELNKSFNQNLQRIQVIYSKRHLNTQNPFLQFPKKSISNYQFQLLINYPKWTQKENVVYLKNLKNKCSGISVKNILIAYQMDQMPFEIKNIRQINYLSLSYLNNISLLQFQSN